MFLPDMVLDDPALAGLGDLEGNVLVVGDALLSSGEVLLTTSDGAPFTLHL